MYFILTEVALLLHKTNTRKTKYLLGGL